MTPIELRADSLERFSKIEASLRQEWDTGIVLPWFRGQADARWSLEPRFHRMRPRDDTFETEYEMREEFAIRARGLLGVKPTDDWDWYVLMQHHGAATRLLDWTEGALLGLYFAVRDHKGNHDAAVWALDPWWLNRLIIRKGDVIPVGDPGVSAHDASRVKRWLPERFPQRTARLPQYPVAVYPTHFVSRIGAQRSCFTVHGRQNGFEGIRERKPRLRKIVIPVASVSRIRKGLEASGIDDSTVYPDLDGLGRAVTTKWLEEPRFVRD